MKVLKYIVMTGLLYAGQTFSSPAQEIYNNGEWLAEQLTQLNVPGLAKPTINQLVVYFSKQTNDFYNDLVNNNKFPDKELFEQEMTLAMQKIIHAVTSLQAKVASRKINTITKDDVEGQIMYLYGKQLYADALYKFPDSENGMSY